MGKFTTTTQGGQISELDKLAAQAQVDLPAGPTEEVIESPQTGTGSILEEISSAPVDAETAGIIEEGINTGIEQEQAVQAEKDKAFVPDLFTRAAETDRVDDYHRLQTTKDSLNQAMTVDGGIETRANNLANKITNKDIEVQSLGKFGSGVIKDAFTTAAAFTPEGSINPDFLRVTGIVTENTFADLAFNKGLDEEADTTLLTETETLRVKQPKETAAVSKAKANERLGRQINQEWHKYKNAQAGDPQAPIPEISKEQAYALGDVAKEIYYEANKGPEGSKFMNKFTTPDGQTAFSFTQLGADLIKKGSHDRKRYFPKQHVRPSKTPLPGGRLVGEGRVYTKTVSSKVGKPVAGMEVLGSAMNNLNKVANVVDKQRLKILLATALPILNGSLPPSHAFAEINHVGQDKVDDFKEKASRGTCT